MGCTDGCLNVYGPKIIFEEARHRTSRKSYVSKGPMASLVWDVSYECLIWGKIGFPVRPSGCHSLNLTDASEVSSLVKIFLSLFPNPKWNPNLYLILDTSVMILLWDKFFRFYSSSEFNSKQHIFIKYLLCARNIDWSYGIWGI